MWNIRHFLDNEGEPQSGEPTEQSSPEDIIKYCIDKKKIIYYDERSGEVCLVSPPQTHHQEIVLSSEYTGGYFDEDELIPDPGSELYDLLSELQQSNKLHIKIK